MYTQFDTAVEDAFLAGDVYRVDIHVHLGRDNLCHLVEQAYAVDAAQTDRGVEIEGLVHIPLDIEDAIAEAGLQFRGHRTVALVDLNLVLIVNIAEGIIAGDGVTAARELILTDIILCDEDGFLAVELLRYHKEFLLWLFLLFLIADKGHVLQPTALLLVFLVLA